MSSHGWNREKLCWNCDPIVNCVTVTCRLIQPMRGFAAMNVPIVLHVQLIEILFVRTVVEIYKNVPNVRKNWLLIKLLSCPIVKR